jgi:prepilin-type processing-associated H-X9-DG protein
VVALGLYAEANDDRLPYRVLDLEDWSSRLLAYGMTAAVFRCPVDDLQRRPTEGFSAIRSYGVNCGPYPAGSQFSAPWPPIRDARPSRLHAVPNHVFLISDNHGQYPGSAGYVGFTEVEGLDGTPWGAHRDQSGRGDNYGYADGHVEYRLKSELDDLLFDPAIDGGPQDPWKWR